MDMPLPSKLVCLSFLDCNTLHNIYIYICPEIVYRVTLHVSANIRSREKPPQVTTLKTYCSLPPWLSSVGIFPPGLPTFLLIVFVTQAATCRDGCCMYKALAVKLALS